MSLREAEYQVALIEDIARFTHNPLGYAQYAFPWAEPNTPLARHEELRTWQADTLSIIGGHLSDPETRYQPCQIAIASGHGVGKLHPYDAIVPTPSGLRRWGDLQAGDAVFGSDGAPARILQTHPFSQVPMYRVTFDDGSHCDVSSGHLWNVRGRHERRNNLESWRTLETVEILERGVRRPNGAAQARQWEIPIQGMAQLDEREVAIHPYLMGVWLGDGTKGLPMWTKPHNEVRDKVRSLGYEVGHSTDLKANRVYGVARLFRGGVFDCGSHDRYIPDEYKFNTVANRMALFEGLCDTDGEANSSGSIGYSTTSKRLADDVVWLARSLGCKARLQATPKEGWYPNENGERVACRTCYRVTINAPFNPFTIAHRRAAYKPSDQRYLVRWIDSIEPLPDADGMCITVDNPDGLYLANDFIVTHNSALIGIVTRWALDTCDDTRIVCTSNTDTQLKTKTVPEVTKWQRMAITEDWFTTTATSIYSTIKDHEKSWRCDFTPWSKDRSEAFAGLHNQGKRLVVIFDEASAIDDVIWEVVEGALTDEHTEIIWLAFGNPTRNTGRFRECFRKYSKHWHTRHIDSRDVEGTNKALFARWAEQYGEESDFFKVRCKGQFPSQSMYQLFDTKDIDAAFGRHLDKTQYEFAPVIIACDPAWTGDDELVIGLRQGLMYKVLQRIPKNDNDVQVANLLARFEDEHQADAVNVDGGYGTGIVSAGRTMNRNWNLVWFSDASSRIDCVNKRAEMYLSARDWLKLGGAIPKEQQLYDEMVAVETVPRLDGKYKLPPKDDMKAILGRSPNDMDCLALTFAHPVATKGQRAVGSARSKATKDYNPLVDRLRRARSR